MVPVPVELSLVGKLVVTKEKGKPTHCSKGGNVTQVIGVP